MFDTYRPSGRFGPMTLPGILVGLLIAIVLGFVYQLALEYIPLIYINFLITLFLGTAIGMVAANIVRIGHVRNVAIAILIGVLLILGTLGSKYFFQYRSMKSLMAQEVAGKQFEDGLGNAINGDDLLKEFGFLDHIKVRVEQGWDIGKPGRNGGAPVSGIFVYLIWLLELGIIGYFAFNSPRAQAGSPYSEKLNAWASEEEHIMMLPITDEEMVAQIKSSTTVDELLNIPIPKTDESSRFVSYRVNSIEGQEMEDAYLSVDMISIVLKSDGEQDTQSDSLVKHAVLSSEQRKQLVENAELLQEAMADYRESLMEESESSTAEENDGESDGQPAANSE